VARVADHLADTSAIVRRKHEVVAARLRSLIRGRRLATCTPVDLEVLYTARTPAEYRVLRADRSAAYARADVTQTVCDRAVEIQALLAERSQHRGINLADLLIAAAAEQAGMTLLHYDAHFDRIAEVTGQPAEWVVPRGSID
jgi:predicted nucleic acid-binding protein